MIPVVVSTPIRVLLPTLAPDVLIDARMRKRAQPETQHGWAPLSVGLGPNFVAGDTVDVAVETSWEDLGAIVTQGPTRSLAGEPRAILGHERDRLVYAPVAGIFRTEHHLRAVVQRGDAVATIDGTVLTAPLDGALRGLTHDGVPVASGTKVIEVDPRGPVGATAGIGERPGRIADGVLTAVQRWQVLGTGQHDDHMITVAGVSPDTTG